MTDPYVVLASDGGSLSSNEISTTGVGVEISAGGTGFGLPGVDLQFDQGAGDGAVYRGKRVQQRSMDLFFHVYGPDRSSLKSTLDRISMIVAHPTTVTFVDPDAGEAWQIVGYRSGGGDYEYGKGESEDSTDGVSFANLSLTLTTETPYWESVTPITLPIPAGGAVTVLNPGTASSPPTWTVEGPTSAFKAVSEAGETLWFSGLVDSGVNLEIDCEDGTVTDSRGHNRYNALTDNPQFWEIPPGESAVTISFDQSSDNYEAVYGTPRHNFVKNPRFQTGATGWTLFGFTYDSTNKRVKQDATLLNDRPYISTTCSGLVEGQTYAVFCDTSFAEPDGGWPPNGTTRYTKITVTDNGIKKARTYAPTWGDYQPPTSFVPLIFTAESTSVTLEIFPICSLKQNGKYARSSGYVDRVTLTEVGGTYFDGATPDTSNMIYDWTGTADNSVSTATPVTIPTGGGGFGDARVTLSFRPRKWLVI